MGLGCKKTAERAVTAAIVTVFGIGIVYGEDSGEIRLQDMVITASGFEQEIRDAPASISVISREELQERQVSNIADAIRGIEGVDVDGLDARSNKTGNREISLRGLPPEYTLILIDGRRQNVPGTVAPNAFTDASSAFLPPVAAIERIEIIRGPMSTLYGSDALGGVINIITRRPGEEWGGSVNLTSTFQEDSDFGGRTQGEIYAAGPVVEDTLALSVYGRAFERSASSIDFPGRLNGPEDTRTMGQDPVKANIRTAGAELLFTPDADNDITLGFDVTRQRYDNRRGQMGRIDSGRGYDTELGFERRQYHLAHEGRYAPGILNTRIYRNENENTGRLIPDAAVPPGSPRLDSDRKLESATDVLDSTFTFFPNDEHAVTVGGQYLRAQLTDGIPDRTFRNKQWALFVEDEWSLRRDLTLTTGVRYEDNDAAGSAVAPRGYLVWNTTDQWTLKGGVARGFRSPFLEQLEDGVIGFGDQGQTALFGNPNLRPEKSTNYEVSAVYDNRRNFFGQLTLFYIDLDNRIERPVAADGASQDFDNVGETAIRGVELSARYQFLEDWTLSGNYTYIDSKVRTGDVEGFERGDPLFPVPEHSVNARLAWQATPALETFMTMEYRSSRFRPDSFHEPHLGGSAQGASEALGDFRSFTVFSLGANYRFSPNVRVGAEVQNLFDKDFNRFKEYPLRNDPSTTAFSNVYNNIYEPRRLTVSMTVDF